MWRANGEVVFHNQLLFFEQHGIEGPQVDIERLYGVIGARRSHTDEGTPLSEWAVPASDVITFLEGGLPLPRTDLPG